MPVEEGGFHVEADISHPTSLSDRPHQPTKPQARRGGHSYRSSQTRLADLSPEEVKASFENVYSASPFPQPVMSSRETSSPAPSMQKPSSLQNSRQHTPMGRQTPMSRQKPARRRASGSIAMLRMMAQNYWKEVEGSKRAPEHQPPDLRTESQDKQRHSTGPTEHNLEAEKAADLPAKTSDKLQSAALEQHLSTGAWDKNVSPALPDGMTSTNAQRIAQNAQQEATQPDLTAREPSHASTVARATAACSPQNEDYVGKRNDAEARTQSANLRQQDEVLHSGAGKTGAHPQMTPAAEPDTGSFGLSKPGSVGDHSDDCRQAMRDVGSLVQHLGVINSSSFGRSQGAPCSEHSEHPSKDSQHRKSSQNKTAELAEQRNPSKPPEAEQSEAESPAKQSTAGSTPSEIKLHTVMDADVPTALFKGNPLTSSEVPTLGDSSPLEGSVASALKDSSSPEAITSADRPGSAPVGERQGEADIGEEDLRSEQDMEVSGEVLPEPQSRDPRLLLQRGTEQKPSSPSMAQATESNKPSGSDQESWLRHEGRERVFPQENEAEADLTEDSESSSRDMREQSGSPKKQPTGVRPAGVLPRESPESLLTLMERRDGAPTVPGASPPSAAALTPMGGGKVSDPPLEALGYLNSAEPIPHLAARHASLSPVPPPDQPPGVKQADTCEAAASPQYAASLQEEPIILSSPARRDRKPKSPKRLKITPVSVKLQSKAQAPKRKSAAKKPSKQTAAKKPSVQTAAEIPSAQIAAENKKDSATENEPPQVPVSSRGRPLSRPVPYWTGASAKDVLSSRTNQDEASPSHKGQKARSNGAQSAKNSLTESIKKPSSITESQTTVTMDPAASKRQNSNLNPARQSEEESRKAASPAPSHVPKPSPKKRPTKGLDPSSKRKNVPSVKAVAPQSTKAAPMPGRMAHTVLSAGESDVPLGVRLHKTNVKVIRKQGAGLKGKSKPEGKSSKGEKIQPILNKGLTDKQKETLLGKSDKSKREKDMLENPHLYTIVNGLVIKEDRGVFPRCVQCKRSRAARAWCGTSTAVMTCLNREILGLPFRPSKFPFVKTDQTATATPAQEQANNTPLGQRKATKKFGAKATLGQKTNDQKKEKKRKAPDPKNGAEHEDAEGKEAKEPPKKRQKTAAGKSSAPSGISIPAAQIPKNAKDKPEPKHNTKQTIFSSPDGNEDEQQADWTQEQLGKLQSAVFGNLDPTAPSYWKKIAKIIPGKKTAMQCYNQYMSMHGSTPAPKPRSKKPRTSKAAAPARGDVPQKLSKAATKKLVRDDRWKQRSSFVGEDDGEDLLEARADQERTDRYIDAIKRQRLGAKQAGKTSQAGAPGKPESRDGRWLVDDIRNGLAAGARAELIESDDEEEKDTYFSESEDLADDV